jgi:Flp pilus assembly protein TadG
MTGRSFLRAQSGAVAVEMALVTPMLLVLMFGGFEVGHFLWSEHKAIEGVRAGVRYASRLPITTVCPTAGAVPSSTVDNIKNVTRTGKLAANAAPVVPGWTNNQVTVTFRCGTYLSTGIYTTLGGQGATVTVASNNLAYPSLFNTLGVIDASYRLNAWSSAAVIGI